MQTPRRYTQCMHVPVSTRSSRRQAASQRDLHHYSLCAPARRLVKTRNERLQASAKPNRCTACAAGCACSPHVPVAASFRRSWRRASACTQVKGSNTQPNRQTESWRGIESGQANQPLDRQTGWRQMQAGLVTVGQSHRGTRTVLAQTKTEAATRSRTRRCCSSSSLRASSRRWSSSSRI